MAEEIARDHRTQDERNIELLDKFIEQQTVRVEGMHLIIAHYPYAIHGGQEEFNKEARILQAAKTVKNNIQTKF